MSHLKKTQNNKLLRH